MIIIQPTPVGSTNFSRSSTATYVGSDGLIKNAAINEARPLYVDGDLQGVLIEEQRTNLVTYSEQFSDAAWSKFATATVTANTSTAPDGTTTADTLNMPASGDRINLSAVAITGGTTYTASLWLSGSGTTFISLASSGGTYTFAAQQITLTATPTRYTVSLATNANNTGVFPIIGRYNGAVGAGTATSAVIWGYQLEAGAFATSYIPTVASQVTRSADVATMTGTNFSSWYNQSEGTFVASALDQNTAPSGAGGYFAAGDNTLAFGSAETIYATRSHLIGASSFGTIIDGGVNQANLGNIVIPSGVSSVGLAYKLNNANMAANGAVGTDDTSCTMPTPTSLSIGSLTSGWNGAGAYLNGHIRQIVYYNTRLPNATLQALTA